MERYRDRHHAGSVVAERLVHHAGRHPLVLGIPRGGLVVAAEIAQRLGGDLDVVIARKLRAPWNPELAVGAVAADGIPVTDEGLASRLGIGQPQLDAELALQTEEVRRQEAAFRAGAEETDPAGRVVIVVDDGVATGATARAALRYLGRKKPNHLCFAVPVAPAQTILALEMEADEVVCPLTPSRFMAVGEWYDEFGQTPDAEVMELLADARTAQG